MSNNDSNDETAVPEFTDDGHIAGFEFTQTEQSRRTNPSTRSEETPLTVDKEVAGVDEPTASLREKDELDAWGGSEPTPEDNSPDTDAVENPLPEEVEWFLPDDSDTDGDGRTGVLSTRTEVHAVVMGITAGAHFATSGDAQLIVDIVGVGTAGDRARQAKKQPDKYREQAKAELPHFLIGVAIGYLGARTDAFSALGTGIGAW